MNTTGTRISANPGDLYMRLAAERSIRRGLEDVRAGRVYTLTEVADEFGIDLEEEDVD